jgi:hypothetical protein
MLWKFLSFFKKGKDGFGGGLVTSPASGANSKTLIFEGF